MAENPGTPAPAEGKRLHFRRIRAPGETVAAEAIARELTELAGALLVLHLHLDGKDMLDEAHLAGVVWKGLTRRRERLDALLDQREADRG